MRRRRGRRQKVASLRDESEWGGQAEAGGFVTNNGVRSDFLDEPFCLVQILMLDQKIGLFRIQNPFSQGFDPLISPAFQIFQLFPQSESGAHTFIFFAKVDFFGNITI
ncbi:MAG: hypothetical protein IPL87_04590 [Candidatus Moraniibacteriota bacterium]|nr:MAG: hypothetical protein IPL87_04590 [Candidatus Moranbacteria bacterium]